MKKLSIVFFIFLVSFCFAQETKVLVTNLPPKTENSVYPLVSIPTNKKAADKINLYMQVSDLENIPNTRKNPFQLVGSGTTSYSNFVYFYEWKKLTTPKNILSIYFSGEASGAYPESFEEWKNFDIRTGNYINMLDLIKHSSVKNVESIMRSTIRNKINAFIKEVKSGTQNDTSKEQIELYEDCLGSIDYRSIDYVDYFIEKDQLVMTSGRCSNHAMRGIDDLGSFEIKIPLKKLEPHLTDYAKNLLSGSQTVVTQPNLQHRIYKGKIDGKYPITLMINQIFEDNSMSITYWYDTHKKLIEWRGTYENNRFTLVEDDYHDEENARWIPKANIILDEKGTDLVGTWEDYKTKKKLKIELQPY